MMEDTRGVIEESTLVPKTHEELREEAEERAKKEEERLFRNLKKTQPKYDKEKEEKRLKELEESKKR